MLKLEKENKTLKMEMKINMNNKSDANHYIMIDEDELGNLYTELGSGREGIVYKYNDNIAIKVLKKDEIDFSNIIKRIKHLITINTKVKNVVFP